MSKFFKFVGSLDREGNPEPSENRVCEVFGLAFPAGEAVEVEDPTVARKLSENPTFKAVEAPRRGRAASAE